MRLGTVFQSIEAWRKLSGITMRPRVAYRILKYTKLITAEYELAEKQRVALIHEVTGTEEGQEVKIEPGTPEFLAYVEKFNVVMETECDLKLLEMDFEEVVEAADKKDDVLTIGDLALLEQFFNSTTEEESSGNEYNIPEEVLDEAD